MKGLAYPNEDQLSKMVERTTLESTLDYPLIAGLLAEAAVSKEDEVAVDTAPVLFRTVNLEVGYEVAELLTDELISVEVNVVTRAAATWHDGIVPVRGSCMTNAPATEEERMLEPARRAWAAASRG